MATMTNRHGGMIAAFATVWIVGAFGEACASEGADTDEALAKQLQNPVANLISLPFQYNFDRGFGLDDGDRHLLNVQPVVPISITEEWNVISRTIVPVIGLDDVPVDGDDEFGLGDVLQSLFFSPKNPTSFGLIWGVGPAFLIPTGTDEDLGREKFGLGPTAVGLTQNGPWTFGLLTNHIWSVAGDDDRDEISSTFLQPFLSYTTSRALTVTLNSESTYDWEEEDWTAPINVIISQLFRFGPGIPPVSIGVGPRYWLETPDGGPDDFGLRAVATVMFPKSPRGQRSEYRE